MTATRRSKTLAAHKASLTVTKNEMAAQEAIVNALQKQAEIEGVASAIKKIDSDNATGRQGRYE